VFEANAETIFTADKSAGEIRAMLRTDSRPCGEKLLRIARATLLTRYRDATLIFKDKSVNFSKFDGQSLIDRERSQLDLVSIPAHDDDILLFAALIARQRKNFVTSRSSL
jgi:hypothetical protein